MTRPALTILQSTKGDPSFGTNYEGYESTSYKPSALDCIGAIVGAVGNLDLAAERLYGPKDPRRPGPDPKALLISTIAEDPSAFDELAKQLRVLTLLDTFQKTQTLAHVVNGTLDKQEPAILAKLYTQMLAVLTTLTDDHTQNINSQSTSVNLNISDQVLRALPPEVREAIKAFQQRPQLPTSNPSLSDPEIKPLEGYSPASPPPNIAVDQDND